MTTQAQIQSIFDQLKQLKLTSPDGNRYLDVFKETLTNYLTVLETFETTQQNILEQTERELPTERELQTKLQEWSSLYNDMLESFDDKSRSENVTKERVERAKEENDLRI